MIQSRKVVTAGAALLLASALAVTTLIGESEITLPTEQANPRLASIDVDPAKIRTWNCEIPKFQPKTIILTCADGGWALESIAWSSWLVEGAHGHATFCKNICEPSCAEGEILHEPVQISLSNVVQRDGEFYFRTLDITTLSGEDSMQRNAERLEWDVMEFVELMDW